VAIVGCGFTGLSSANHLKEAEPGLSVALPQDRVIGFETPRIKVQVKAKQNQTKPKIEIDLSIISTD
jgi:hypothetical protein